VKDLHPTARALVEAGLRGERPLDDDRRARVRKAVLWRAGAAGAAVATTTTATVAAKAGVLAGVVMAIGLAGTLARVMLVTEPPAPSSAAASRSESSPLRSPPATTNAPRATTKVPPASAGADAARSPSGSVRSSTPVAPSPSRSPTAELHPLRSAKALPAGGAQEPLGQSQAAASEIVGRSAPGVSSDSIAEVPSSSVPPEPPRHDLAAEVALLHRAHAALRSGQPATALSLIEQGASLNRGPLAEQAEIVRIAALCQTGREQDARAAVDRFVAQWPSSPATTRLRGGCEAAASGRDR
jgi:hypothetical protein